MGEWGRGRGEGGDDRGCVKGGKGKCLVVTA